MSHETPPSPAESCTRWPSGYKSSPALACKSCRVKHQPLWPIGNNDPVVTLISRVMGGSPPGSAGVPPAHHWQSLAHLLDPDRPAKTPGLCLGRAHAVPAGRVDGCGIAGKLSDNPRERMRAGRPRSRVGRFRHDCPSRESRRKRTGWMVALNPDLTITSWPVLVLRFTSWITLLFVCFK